MSDMLSAIQECIKDELEKQADKEIENLVNDFRNRLNKRKAEIVGELVNGIEVLTKRDSVYGHTQIQINITGR